MVRLGLSWLGKDLREHSLEGVCAGFVHDFGEHSLENGLVGFELVK